MPSVIPAALAALTGLPALAAPSRPNPPEEQITAPSARPPPPHMPERRRTVGVEPGANSDTPEGLGLRPERDGSYTYVDPARRFTAKITPDGRVQLADRWRRPSPRQSQRGRCCAPPPEGAWGANPFFGMPVPGLLELLYRLHGVDPTAAAKSHFLDRTRAFRTRLAIDWHLANLKARLSALHGELTDIWHDRGRTPAERRRLLFERWDESDERFRLDLSDLPDDAITVVDEARVETAEAARDQIEAFIRRHLPAGSKDAYPAAEVRRLNARRTSHEPFRPYRARKDAPAGHAPPATHAR